MILKLFRAVQKLENFSILVVPTQIVSEVVDVVAVVAKMEIKVEWIDKVLGKIGAKNGLTLSSALWSPNIEELE